MTQIETIFLAGMVLCLAACIWLFAKAVKANREEAKMAKKYEELNDLYKAAKDRKEFFEKKYQTLTQYDEHYKDSAQLTIRDQQHQIDNLKQENKKICYQCQTAWNVIDEAYERLIKVGYTSAELTAARNLLKDEKERRK